jgi:L,D-transpeptidase-like protein
MIDKLNIPAGIALCLVASIPAWAFAQSPQDRTPPVAIEAPIAAAAPPPLPVLVIPDGISPEVWRHALAAHEAARAEGMTTRPIVTVIDYSRPATEKRLWVVDVESDSILATEYVAHGEGSGGLVPSKFSNQDGSHQSSLGTFITGETFIGVRGRSLPLHGVEAGINDNAYTRGLLIHGTPNVSEARALRGTMGLTEGCAGVPSKSARRLIKLIGEGTVVFVWYPDRGFLERSKYLDAGEVTERLAAL